MCKNNIVFVIHKIVYNTYSLHYDLSFELYEGSIKSYLKQQNLSIFIVTVVAYVLDWMIFLFVSWVKHKTSKKFINVFTSNQNNKMF